MTAILVLIALAPAAPPVDFATQVRPLFETHCVSCHGPTKQKAGLRLSLGRQVLKGSINGPVVVPKKADESKLIHALRGTEADQMPPKGPLPEADIALIARWIDEGAVVPATEAGEAKHWAFVPPKQAPVPAGVHPIDHFLEVERQKQNLTAAPPADTETLARRLHLDLTGLPPTPQEIVSFAADGYEKRLDALLATPAYGERWGRHLLDVWRYADWYGFGAELRNSQKHIWNWRDWTVESLNANKPYDRMVREMLAADELAGGDVRATGYLARSYYKFSRNVWLDDIVEHTGKAFLGVTLNCCRCHDHMYDPLPQTDYYRFRAIFEPHQLRLDPVPGEPDPEKMGVPRVFDADAKAVTYLFERGDDKRPVKDKPLQPGVPAALANVGFTPTPVPLSPELTHPTLRESVQKAQIEAAAVQLKTFPTGTRHLVAVIQLQAVKAKLAADKARYATPPHPRAADLIRHAVVLHLETMALAAEADLEEAEAKKAKNLADLRAKVATARKACETPPADYPPLVPSYPEQSTGRRLALANWITSAENPLTARVFVNHVWLRHFGQPLVPTMFDFGKNGRGPTNPALLDWLAVEFVKSGWDVNKLHRLMLTSQAYRMRSSMAGPVAESNRSRDPDNLFVWKMTPRSLEAEAIRDSLLAVSGLLDSARGGPDLDYNDDAPKMRRSIYYRHAPEKVMPFLAAFDAPSPTECYRRATTVVPQQAMALTNSKLSARAAEAVAKSIVEKEPAAVVESIYAKLLGRKPSAVESKLCVEFLTANPPAMLVQVVFNHADFATIR